MYENEALKSFKKKQQDLIDQLMVQTSKGHINWDVFDYDKKLINDAVESISASTCKIGNKKFNLVHYVPDNEFSSSDSNGKIYFMEIIDVGTKEVLKRYDSEDGEKLLENLFEMIKWNQSGLSDTLDEISNLGNEDFDI
ncbi:hypothetical protein JEZ13_10580 [bacterium]|nr:hypothetical protein [bacterium]